ncbi:ISL3 family transposase, partial [Limosilactobacillus sp. Lr3000]|nr:ISL3 family transposase [Limosilactobacillus albertensis]MCD7121043.1 ISL3 family transposase [Limosilactobacillus albertensis]
LNGIRYELELWKQRYYCRQCQTTFGATTNLTANNQTLSGQLKNQIMEFAKEGLNGKLIARVCHCSPSSVRRTIKERIKP